MSRLLQPDKGDLSDLKKVVSMAGSDVRKLVLWAEEVGYNVIKDPFDITGMGFLIKCPDGRVGAVKQPVAALNFLDRRRLSCQKPK